MNKAEILKQFSLVRTKLESLSHNAVAFQFASADPARKIRYQQVVDSCNFFSQQWYDLAVQRFNGNKISLFAKSILSSRFLKLHDLLMQPLPEEFTNESLEDMWIDVTRYDVDWSD